MFSLSTRRKTLIKDCLITIVVISAANLLLLADGEKRKWQNKKPRMRSLFNEFNRNQGRGDMFVWQVGKWKDCIMDTSCAQPGYQKRSLTCLDASKTKTYSRLCDRKQRPSRRRHCVFAECKNQTIFKLRFWPWSACTSYPLINSDHHNHNESTTMNDDGTGNPSSTKGYTGSYPNFILESSWRNRVVETCGSPQDTIVFVKRRNISCIAHWPNHNAEAEVSFDDCFGKSEKKPRGTQVCSFGCQQKCVVTVWSEWDSCETCRRRLIYRKREIAFFQSKNNNTDKCPELVQINTTKSTSNKSTLYQIRATEWSACEMFTSKKGGRSSSFLWNNTSAIGLRRRSLTCEDQQGKTVKCDNAVLSKLPTVEACIMPRDCIVGPWEEWFGCQKMKQKQDAKTENFMRRRLRRIVRAPVGDGKPCPNLVEFRLCRPPEIPKYEQQDGGNRSSSINKNETYEWFVGKFDKCKSDDKDSVSGRKRRHVFCVRRGDAGFNPVGLQFCVHLDKPVEELFCRIPSRQICILGEWSAWSGCTADCSGKNSTGTIRGTHYRLRRVIQYSSDRRACEDYAQSRPCKLDSCVSWVAGTQTVCLMDNIHRTCGNGKTHRAVYCLDSRGLQVKDSLCNGDRPPRSLPCHVPCADDCVVGTWSEWGPCEGECGRNGTQGNSIQRRRQRILAYPGWSGRPCPAKRQLLQSQSCLGMACGTYHWKAAAWSDCKLRNSRGNIAKGDRKCVIGHKQRSVTCVDVSGRNVRDYLCTRFLRPADHKDCHVCPEDCVLSPWTEWSSCPVVCTGLGKFDDPKRKRLRFIVTPGRDGGLSCPEASSLVQIEPCKNCQIFRWKYSKWSSCISTPGGSCSGLKSRSVYCTAQTGRIVEDGYCFDHSLKPREIIECQDGCRDEECKLTDWSEWSKCTKPCGSSGYSTRFRNVVGNRIRCDPSLSFTDKRPCNTHACGHYSLQIGKWSPCYAKDPNVSCSSGIQWRNIKCFKISGPEVPLDYCIEVLYGGELALASQRTCEIECPKDCTLSPWTEFTPCSRKCGAGVKTRFRRILQQATHGGMPCISSTKNSKKQVIETVTCRVEDCFNYVWRADPWEECQPQNQTRGRITKCGTGIHARRVHCIDKRLSGLRSIVNESLCDALEKPETRKPCSHACPGDCVVGEWTLWTRCSSRCPRPGHRRRERGVLRHPAHDGKACPVLEQYTPCNVDHCYTYHWKLTAWSSCLFYQANASCGIGRQNRLVDCSRSDGKIVHSFYCRLEGRRVPSLLRMCNVPCPRNCELSEWQTWSNCPESCGMASVQSRRRSILAKAGHGGQPCLQSDSLRELRACRIKPCYTVAMGQWSSCLSDINNGCGVGTRHRSLHCRRDDGKVVDDYYCPKINHDYKRIASCSTPCKGDCVVSEWSSWSRCFGSCSVANKTVVDIGVRIRTRVIVQEAGEFGTKCPRNLVHKDDCRDPQCFSFAWKVGPYVGKAREVWCQRSDGLNVTHGCSPSQQPSTAKFCHPACSVRNSFCNSKTICACRQRFIPILGSTGHLIHCLSDTNPIGNNSNDVGILPSTSGDDKDKSWFADLPIIIWVVIGVFFVYFFLFLTIVIVYTRRRTQIARERRAKTCDVATATNPERIPLTERAVRHERTDSKVSFATSSGRGSTLSAISDHDDADAADQWPEPPDDVVSEFIRHHLKNFTTGASFCSDDFSSDSLHDESNRNRTLNSMKKVKFEPTGTL